MSEIKVPAEPTDKMVSAGLVALVKEIERLGGNPKDATSDNQRYMQIGSLIRCGSEIKAVYKAMITQAACEGNSK